MVIIPHNGCNATCVHATQGDAIIAAHPKMQPDGILEGSEYNLSRNIDEV